MSKTWTDALGAVGTLRCICDGDGASNPPGARAARGIPAMPCSTALPQESSEGASSGTFAQRYWKIMDELSLEAIECTKPDGGVVSSSDRKVVIAFLMLSEDELDLRANRWISADTWELWRDGMAARLSRWPFDAVWADVCETEKDAEDAQFSRLREAGAQLGVVGFEPARAGNRLPWQSR